MLVNKKHIAEDGVLAPLFEKSDTEPKPNLFRCKDIVIIVTSNVRTLNTINQLLKLITYAAE